MLAKIQSFVLAGIDDGPCDIEVDYEYRDMSWTGIVGLPDAAVREALQRVESATQNSGYGFPRGRLLISLAPAAVRKEGAIYDLPIALGILTAAGTICMPTMRSTFDPRRFLFVGELGLDGGLRPVKGAISLALHAKKRGLRGIVLPHQNAREAAAVDGIEVYGVTDLATVVGMINETHEVEPEPAIDFETLIADARAPVDMGDIKGQEAAKRAVIIAVAGGHNVLAVCPIARHGLPV